MVTRWNQSSRISRYWNPSWKFIPHKTLLFFDELQKCPDCATSLKSFCEDGRYDVICSGSLMGIYYEEIESNAVGFKEDYEMHSMDFEEFLWAKGYSAEQIESLYQHMPRLLVEALSKGISKPLTYNRGDWPTQN